MVKQRGREEGAKMALSKILAMIMVMMIMTLLMIDDDDDDDDIGYWKWVQVWELAA